MSNDIDEVAQVIDDDFIARAIANKERTFYVAAEHRLGFMALASFVEYTFFHPIKGPRSNEEFHFYIINFLVQHRMFSVPKEFEEQVNNIAQILKLQPRLGSPFAIISGVIVHFPGTIEANTGRPNLYGIERGDQLVYNDDRALNRQIKERENQIVDLLLEHGPIISAEEVANKLWRLH